MHFGRTLRPNAAFIRFVETSKSVKFECKTILLRGRGEELQARR